jgi:enoyl-CoA hydratase/carnithine racemase
MPQAFYAQDGDVGELVLDAPPLNLFGRQLFDDLEAAIAELRAAPPRALIFRAQGDVVSAGVDVQVFDGLGSAGADELTARLLRFTHALEDLPFPTLAVAHGLCLTAALELSLACDLLWAGEGVQFGLVEAVVGITPLMGGTQRMAERAGAARAREFVMTGGLFTAETLHDWGVVNRVLPGEELLEQARRFAARLAAGPTQAHAATKRIVRAQADHGTRGADERTAALTSHLFDTQDTRNAVLSFLEHGPGKATFNGQ